MSEPRHSSLRIGVWVTLWLLANSSQDFLQPFFSWLFPQQAHPIYQQDPFWSLTLSHLLMVASAGGLASLIGIGAGLWVTHRHGAAFRPLAETLCTLGQALPPVAVLAVAIPVMGFSPLPTVIALFLYGLMPILQGTLDGMKNISREAQESARGCGMDSWQILRNVELPLAAPVIINGIRLSLIISIGTAALASTVGVKSLGSPIIIGLGGFNSAYIIQGGVLIALLALTVDCLCEGIHAVFSLDNR